MVNQENNPGRGLALLAADLMEYLKARAALGEKLNAEAIAAFLTERPEVVDPAAEAEPPEDGAGSDELKARLARLGNQKQELLRPAAAEAEDAARSLEDFMRRVAPDRRPAHSPRPGPVWPSRWRRYARG